jgi:hypothetical protein
VKSEWKPVLYIDEIYLYTALVERIAYCVNGKKLRFFPKPCHEDTEGEYCFFNLGAGWGGGVNIPILRTAWGLQSPSILHIYHVTW